MASEVNLIVHTEGEERVETETLCQISYEIAHF